MPNLNYHFLTFLILLCLISVITKAQVVYEGQVINSKTELVISSVTVTLIKEKTGTQTNERGYFSLVSNWPIANDTLQFSSIGYITFKLPVSAYERQMFIPLEHSTTQLEEISITDSKIKTVTLGRFSHFDLKNTEGAAYTHTTQLIVSRAPLAKLFTAPQANARLTGIALGRQDFPTAPTFSTINKFTTFLIHAIAQDTTTGTPGKVLFTKNVSLTDNSKWVDIDLNDEIVIIPGKNFFIAVEWMIIPYNEIIAIYGASKVDRLTKHGQQVLKDASEYRVYYQPFLVGYQNENTLKPALLYTKVNNKWQIIKKDDIALSATLHY